MLRKSISPCAVKAVWISKILHTLGWPIARACRARSGLKTFGEGFALKKLHAKKIDLALRGEGGVDIENLAHVGMANRARVPHLRGQSVAEARLCALYGDARWQTWIQSFIQGFVDDAHPALAYLTLNQEAFGQQVAGLERVLGRGRVRP